LKLHEIKQNHFRFIFLIKNNILLNTFSDGERSIKNAQIILYTFSFSNIIWIMYFGNLTIVYWFQKRKLVVNLYLYACIRESDCLKRKNVYPFVRIHIRCSVAWVIIHVFIIHRYSNINIFFFFFSLTFKLFYRSSRCYIWVSRVHQPLKMSPRLLLFFNKKFFILYAY
jgi:hypothetical protein